MELRKFECGSDATTPIVAENIQPQKIYLSPEHFLRNYFEVIAIFCARIH